MNPLEDSFRFTQNSHIKAKHRNPHLFSLFRKHFHSENAPLFRKMHSYLVGQHILKWNMIG